MALVVREANNSLLRESVKTDDRTIAASECRGNARVKIAALAIRSVIHYLFAAFKIRSDIGVDIVAAFAAET